MGFGGGGALGALLWVALLFVQSGGGWNGVFGDQNRILPPLGLTLSLI
jgi:hypothetical protein